MYDYQEPPMVVTASDRPTCWGETHFGRPHCWEEASAGYTPADADQPCYFRDGQNRPCAAIQALQAQRGGTSPLTPQYQTVLRERIPGE